MGILEKLTLTSTLLLCAPAFAGVTPAYELLSTSAQLMHEYCDYNYDWVVLAHRGNPACRPPQPLTQVLKIYIPLPYGSVFARHVKTMDDRSYFREMDMADFFHGHIIPYGKTDHYPSLGDFLSDITGILYHTEEFTGYWENEQGNLPPERKTPRSLLGKPDGSLIPAIQAIDPARLYGNAYETAGTIYTNQLVASNPSMTRLIFGDFGQNPTVSLTYTAPDSGRKWSCDVDNLLLLLRPMADGRFHLRNGAAYDIYLLCATELKVTD